MNELRLRVNAIKLNLDGGSAELKGKDLPGGVMK